MDIGGLVQALTKIAAQPDKDSGELVRQRRRKQGLPVAPAGKVLPFAPARNEDNTIKRVLVDAAADCVLQDSVHGDELHDEHHAVHLRLVERRMEEALVALENATLRGASTRELLRLEEQFAVAVANFEALSVSAPPP